MYIDTYQEYVGYYYEFAGRKYIGKEFSINAPELIEISSSKINPLLNNPSTFTYGLLSKVNPRNISSINFNSIPSDVDSSLDWFDDSDESYYTYFTKKVISSIIKQIDKKTSDQLKGNPLYQTTVLDPELSNLDQAEAELPGIRAFIKRP